MYGKDKDIALPMGGRLSLSLVTLCITMASLNEARTVEHREDRQALVDLITCPRSPWRQQCSWSPEAELLREAAVRTPEHLHSHTNPTVFRTLRVVDQGVYVIDDGLLKFSNLETLVLSANKICNISAGHLPTSLKVLELHANLLCSLTSLIQQNFLELQHLGVGSNRLGSHDDAHHLTGEFWPRLVSLDLSWCEFQDQRVLAQALATLACLRTLSLEGNPLTLVPSYPGFIIDSLQPLLYLDAQLVAPDQRHGFKGLSREPRDVVILEQAVATVRIQRVRGVPEPQLDADPSPPEFPVVEHSYRVTYDFLQQHPPDRQQKSSPQSPPDSVIKAHVKDDDVTNIKKTDGNCEQDKSATSISKVQINCPDATPVLTHTTAALAWDQCMEFLHTQTLIVQDLPALKRFLIRGLWLTLEEDKVLSWPAMPEETKPTQTPKDRKGAKGKELSSKASSREKSGRSKDKKKKPVTDLVQDAPITTVLGCVHVPLHSLLKGDPTVTVRCDLGFLPTKPALRPDGPTEKDSVSKTKDDKQKEEKKSKSTGDGTPAQRNTGSSKGRGKARKNIEVEVHTEDAGATHQEPITVEFSVNLEKWRSVSEATQESKACSLALQKGLLK